MCLLAITSLSCAASAFGSYETTLDVVSSVEPGDTVTVELSVRPTGSEPVPRFNRAELSIHFDSSALSLVSLTIPDSLVTCGWSPPRFYLAMPGTESCGSAQIQIILDASDTWYSSPCDEINSVIVRLEFETKPDTSLFGDTALIQFCWKSCEDNRMSSQFGDTTVYGREVLNWLSDTLTDTLSALPSEGGINHDCLEGVRLTGMPYLRAIDFIGGAVLFKERAVVGEEGDVNLDGSAYDIADLSLLGWYCLVGSPAFTIDSMLQRQASDIDQDGILATVSDWVALRYRIVGTGGGGLSRLSPRASFELLRGDYSTEVYIDADEPTNAYAVWMHSKYQRCDSIRLAHAANGASLEASLIQIDDTLVQVAFSAGDAGQPAIAAGYHKLFTVYHDAGAITEMIKVEASTPEPRLFTIDIATSIDENVSVPSQFELGQNYPNPFNPGTSVQFTLPLPASWRLVIFDLLGRRVVQFEDRDVSGTISVYWDGYNANGQSVPSGVYFYRLSIGDQHTTKKMLLLR